MLKSLSVEGDAQGSKGHYGGGEKKNDLSSSCQPRERLCSRGGEVGEGRLRCVGTLGSRQCRGEDQDEFTTTTIPWFLPWPWHAMATCQ